MVESENGSEVPKYLSEILFKSASALNAAAAPGIWPTDDSGTACNALVQDLGEFLAAMGMCAAVNHWSVARALDRLLLDREQVLLGVSSDPRQARRYLRSIEEAESGGPQRRARPEDVFTEPVKKNLGAQADGFRDYFVQLSAAASEWYVHPTCWGPFASHQIQNGLQNADWDWSLTVSLAWMSIHTVVLASRFQGVRLPSVIDQALYDLADGLEMLKSPIADLARGIQLAMAAEVSSQSG